MCIVHKHKKILCQTLSFCIVHKNKMLLQTLSSPNVYCRIQETRNIVIEEITNLVN